MQIMVKQWPEMVEASSRYDPPKSILVPPEKTKNDHFGSFSGSVSRASRASMSLESLLHDAKYGETMAENG